VRAWQGRSPYYEIEFFCIMVFTIEFVLRIARRAVHHHHPMRPGAA